MESGLVWILNLAGETEASGQAPSPAPPQLPGIVQWLRASGLLAPSDVIASSSDAEGAWAGRRGRLFCQTESAQKLAKKLGVELPRVTAWSTMKRLLGRDFAADALGLCLGGAAYVRSSGEVAPTFERIAAFYSGHDILARRRYGFAGKGRRRVKTRPSPEDTAFLSRAIGSGGVLLEPYLVRTEDFALHGWVDGRTLVFGQPTRSVVDAGGVWRDTVPARSDLLASSERDSLFSEASRCGQALIDEGYSGPFGIDAFRYEVDGRTLFQPRSELNPRYSMGWAVGMGKTRPDRD